MKKANGTLGNASGMPEVAENQYLKYQNRAGIPHSKKDQDPQEKNHHSRPLHHEHRHRLEDLAQLIKSFFPHRETVNKYHRILIPRLETAFSDKDIRLFHRLLKSITLLHQKQRIENHFGKFYTEPTDIYITLFLMERLTVTKRPGYLLSRPERWFYSLLLSRFGDTPFTRRQAQEVSGLSKTSTHWKLWELMTKGLVERGGNRNKGYRYRIIES